ncbi:MAG: hypothetical protein ACRD2Q_00805 [Terriglobales bacterium]
MRNTKQIPQVGLLLMTVLLGAVMFAQAAPGPARFTVPFDFAVGADVLPAGEYSVQPALSDRSDRILLRSRDGRTVTTIFAVPVKSQQASSQTTLVFKRYGDRYFLSQIWTQGSTVGREVPASSAEQEARKQSEAKLAVIAAREK